MTQAVTPVITSGSKSIAKKILFKIFSHIQHGGITMHEGSDTYFFGDKNAPMQGSLHIHKPHVYKQLLFNGDIAMSEAYMRGEITSNNIVDVIRVLARQQALFKKIDNYTSYTSQISATFKHFMRKNTKAGSKKNITAHYDLGNDFFAQFLDPTRMYSSAVYTSSDMALHDASLHKLKTICDNLQLSEQDHLLEIGTGWGGLAVYAAKHYGCKVSTTTISREQFTYAQELVDKEGLGHLVTLLEEDYRDLTGTYDKVVSIEMIEAVGHQYLSCYLQKINNLVKKGGQVLLQAIMLPDQKFDRARYRTDFIKTHIFPGGFLPSVNAITAQTKKHTTLNLVDYVDITQSYAYTLRDWRLQFDKNEKTINELGYPKDFCRLWRFYLAYCEGGFRERVIYCAQLKFEKNSYL